MAEGPIISAAATRVIYEARSGDWRIVVGEDRFFIVPIATGGLEYASGANLDNLASLIVAAKADAGARGINWLGA